MTTLVKEVSSIFYSLVVVAALYTRAPRQPRGPYRKQKRTLMTTVSSIRVIRCAVGAGVLALLITLPASVGVVRAQSGERTRSADVNLGYWAQTCRAQYEYSELTITFGSDGLWAPTTCNNLEDTNLNYHPFPLTERRPGTVQCAEIYTYGGYWLLEKPPYTQGYTGQAQIVVRDDPYQDGADLPATVCNSVIASADQSNAQNGFNSSADPLAPVQDCSGCGGGGGPPPPSAVSSLPKAPRAIKKAQKPVHCLVDDKGHVIKKSCHRPK